MATDNAASMQHTQLRILIVGDSMTQGGEGDWTWRYRLWQWLQNEGEDVKFVGSYTGTHEPEESHPPQPPPLYKHHSPANEPRVAGGYAVGVDECFDRHHFSIWGRQCAQAKDLVYEELCANPADVVLVMLGFNDLGWLVSDAIGTLLSMKAFVDNVRKAKSDVQLAIANIPQRTPMSGRDDLPRSTREYNHLLREAIHRWTTKESQIHLVELCEEYEADVATYDGLHPNYLGDYQIARAFSVTLVRDFHLGHNAIVLPDVIPPRPLPTPTSFRMVTSLGGVTATWDKVYGCGAYEMRKCINDGEYTTEPLSINRWDSHWASDGELYRAQVRACHGDVRSPWTPMLQATAHPHLTPAPAFKAQSSLQCLTISWEPPVSSTPIVQYTVLWRDTDGSAWFPNVGGFKHSPAHIEALETGHTYDVWMLTWNTAGEGPPGPITKIIVQ